MNRHSLVVEINWPAIATIKRHEHTQSLPPTRCRPHNSTSQRLISTAKVKQQLFALRAYGLARLVDTAHRLYGPSPKSTESNEIDWGEKQGSVPCTGGPWWRCIRSCGWCRPAGGKSWRLRRRPSTRNGAPRSPTSPLLQGSGAEQNSLKSPEESGSMEETTNRSAREQDQGKGKTEALIGRREGAARSLVPCEGVGRRARPGEAAQQRRWREVGNDGRRWKSTGSGTKRSGGWFLGGWALGRYICTSALVIVWYLQDLQYSPWNCC